MDDYRYYGLFLTQESKDKLAKWLFFNGYSPESELMKKRTGWYLDHCTLLHKSQRTSHFLLEDTLGTALIMYGSIIESIKIVTYCYWNYVVPISEFNFEDLHSNILNALR